MLRLMTAHMRVRSRRSRTRPESPRRLLMSDAHERVVLQPVNSPGVLQCHLTDKV